LRNARKAVITYYSNCDELLGLAEDEVIFSFSPLFFLFFSFRSSNFFSFPGLISTVFQVFQFDLYILQVHRPCFLPTMGTGIEGLANQLISTRYQRRCIFQYIGA
jgi:hypothetical protein